MKFASLIPLLGFICNLLLAVFVLSRNARSPAARVYFFLGLVIANWNLGQFQLFIQTDQQTALFWARQLHFGLCFGIVLFFHLSLIIARIRPKWWIIPIYGFQSLIAVTVFTPYFIKDVRYFGASGWYSIAGPVYYVFAATYGLTFVSILLLLGKRDGLGKLQRRGLDTMILGQSLLAFLGANDILPILGIDYYPFTRIQVYPYGGLGANFYGIIIAYSVLQHQILDIHLAVSKWVAHAVRLFFMFFTGLILLLAIAIFAPSKFNTVSFLSALAVLLVSGFVASVFFPRLFGSGAESLERRILGDSFEYHDRIRSFISSIPNYSDSSALLADLGALLVRTVGVSNYQLMLQDETSKGLRPFASNLKKHSGGDAVWPAESAVLRHFQVSKIEYLMRSRDSEAHLDDNLEAEARSILQQHNAELCFPFVSEDGVFGLLLLGEKSNGEPYTATDVSLLISMARGLSLVINQVRLKDQVNRAHEVELLGRMSRGMAHDLNNLLTPVWTMLQLSQEGVPPQEAGDLVGVALRNINVMRSYIHESLFFSENLRPDFKLGRLDALVAQSLEVTSTRKRRNRVDVLLDSPGEVLVEMDEVLIQRLVTNIVSNAVDASPHGGTVRIVIDRTGRRGGDVDWVRVRVIDTGKGIRAEDLERVYRPYFTTKDRGDDTRGFGLGLAISRKIVDLHKGRLHIASKVNEGTTVIVDLPTRHAEQAERAASNHS